MSITTEKDVSHGVCKTVKLFSGYLQCNGGGWEKLKTSNVASSFIVCSNRNRPALVRDF